MQTKLHQLSPIIDFHSKIIILGSFPSLLSLKNSFYYANPQNRFWTVISTLFDRNLTSVSNEEKTAFLLGHHIALYDVIEKCDIKGSSDSSIINVIPADIPGFIQNSEISHVFLNGKKAYQIFCKYYPELLSTATVLPSTSSANASKNLDSLLNEWRLILNYIK